MPNTLTFDIETGPLDLEKIQTNMPKFEAPGNYKDKSKIARNIETQQEKWVDKAALRAETCRVLCIGYQINDEKGVIIDSALEYELLTQFWALVGSEPFSCVLGHNHKSFDIPILFRRSWYHGIKPYDGWFDGKYFHSSIKDTQEHWFLGKYGEKVSLNSLARFFGLPGKKDDGKLFYKRWQNDRKAAIAYCLQDVSLTYNIARKMMIL